MRRKYSLPPINASEETESGALTVETIDNHVYFYTEVTPDRTLALMQTLRMLDSKLRTEKISRRLSPGTVLPIWLHINSTGGDPFSAFAVYDQIKQLPTPVYSIAEGQVNSAATIISVGCHARFCQPSAFMLIHSPASLNWGWYTHTELENETRFLETVTNQMIAHYAKHSKLDGDTIRSYMDRDWWMTAAQMLEYGFADEYLEGDQP